MGCKESNQTNQNYLVGKELKKYSLWTLGLPIGVYYSSVF